MTLLILDPLLPAEAVVHTIHRTLTQIVLLNLIMRTYNNEGMAVLPLKELRMQEVVESIKER